MKNTEEIKNFEESLTYLCEKYNETWQNIDLYENKLLEARRILKELTLKIEAWEPKSN